MPLTCYLLVTYMLLTYILLTCCVHVTYMLRTYMLCTCYVLTLYFHGTYTSGALEVTLVKGIQTDESSQITSGKESFWGHFGVIFGITIDTIVIHVDTADTILLLSLL